MTPLLMTPQKTALIVVDMQNGFLRNDGFMAKVGLDISRCQQTVEPIHRLVEAFHQVGSPVIFTQMVLRADYKDAGILPSLFPGMQEVGAMIRGTWDAAIIEELTPEAVDWIVEKARYSAFYNTNLEVILRGLGVNTLVITGVTTNICVESTLRDAFFRDYQVILPQDATAAVSKAMEEGTFLTVHYGFGRLSSTSEVLSALEAGIKMSELAIA